MPLDIRLPDAARRHRFGRHSGRLRRFMRKIHSPFFLADVEDARARAFIVLFTCDSIARSILMTIVPLEAYRLLGAAQAVSVAYFAVAIVGLLTVLAVPVVMHRLRRRWVMTLGALVQLASTACLAVGERPALIVGLVLQAIALASLEVVINLYLLDHIPRRRLNVFEPKRLLFAGSAFAAGPWVGVYLHRNVAEALPFIIAGLASLTLLTFFWMLRLADDPGLQAGKAPPPSPLAFVRRFAIQPRLVLAWVLALGRNGFWVMYYIYTPIYAASAGFAPEVGGAVVSIGMLPMLLVRIWGRIGQRIGVRNLLSIGYGGTGVFCALAAIAAGAGHAVACLIFVCAAAFAATVIDGAGNVPFLRAVHPYERTSMTSVFMTFRHVGSLMIPGVLALVLLALPLAWVFAVGALLASIMAWLSRYLPRRL